MANLKVTFTAEYSEDRDYENPYYDVNLTIKLPADSTHTDVTQGYLSFLRALGYSVDSLVEDIDNV